MNTRILLVEGTCGAGKSTLLQGLLTQYVREEERPRTLLYLTQAHTYFPLVSPDRPTPVIKRQHREHLRKVIRALDWNTQGLTPPHWFTFYSLIDTLHLTHAFRPGSLSWSEMGYIDLYLASLGASLIFLRAKPETLWKRLIAQGAVEESIQYYVREQEQMETLAHRSSLATLFLPAEAPPAELLKRAHAFWMKEK